MQLRMTRRIEDLQRMSRTRHRLGDRGRARADTRHGRRRPDLRRRPAAGTRATSRSCATRARLIQAELWFDDDTLGFKTRGNRSATSVTLVQGNELPDRRVPRRPRPPAHEGRTSAATTRRSARRSTRRPGRRSSRPSRPAARAGPRCSSGRSASAPSQLVRDVPLANGEATAWAKAEMLRRSRSFVTVVGVDARHARTWSSAARRAAARRGRRSRATATTSRASATPTTSTSAIARTSRPSGRRWPWAAVTLMPRPDGDARRYFGVYPAIVTDIVDTDEPRPDRGQVPVARRRRAPTTSAPGRRSHARMPTTTRASRSCPSVDTQVVVAFEAGDLRRPYILGACWNGVESLPEARGGAEQQAADQEPQREQARVRRHRGRRQGHAVDAERPQGRARRLRPAGDGQSPERLHDGDGRAREGLDPGELVGRHHGAGAERPRRRPRTSTGSSTARR